MSAKRTVYEPGDRLVTISERGRALEWEVQPDGLPKIVAGGMVDGPLEPVDERADDE